MRIGKAIAAAAAALALAGPAKAGLILSEAEGSTFDQHLRVTPTGNNLLVFSVSGLGSQFDSLQFSFVGVPGLAVTATPYSLDHSLLMAAFNDPRNPNFSLAGGTGYDVEISGRAADDIPGGFGTVTVTTLNGVIPEPGSLALLGTSLCLLGALRRRGGT